MGIVVIHSPASVSLTFASMIWRTSSIQRAPASDSGIYFRPSMSI